MGIFDRLLARKPSSPRTADEILDPEWTKSTVIPSTSPGGLPGVAGFLTNSRLPKRGTQEILFAYSNMPYLRSAIAKIATNAANTPLHLYGKKGKGSKKYQHDTAIATAPHGEKQKRLKASRASGSEFDELVDHPMAKLLRKPWPGMRGRTLLQLTFSWLDLVGDAFWCYNTNNAGMPIEIFAIPPHWVAETPSRDRPFFIVRINGAQFEVPITNMLWFKDPSLENPYGRGAGIGASLADELDIDENASKHVSSYFFNRAMPDMLVSVEGADEHALEATKARFEQDHRGFVNAHRTAFLSGKVTVERLDTTFKDMDLVDLRKFSGRDIVIQALGLSPEMLGILDNSNRATISEARAMFAENVLMPRLALVEEVLQEFAALFDERIIVAFEDPTPNNLDFTLKAMQAHQSSVSENEWRTLQGLEPVEGGDVYRVPAGTVPAERLDSGLLDPNAMDATGEVDPALAGAGAAVQDTALNGAQVSSLLEIITAVGIGTMPKLTARGLILAAFPGMTPEEVDAILAPIVEGSQKPVAEVAPAKPADVVDNNAKYLRPRIKASDFIDEGDIPNILEELRPERLTEEVYPLAHDTMEQIGIGEAGTLGATESFSMLNPLITEYLDSFAATKIEGLVDETTRQSLRDTLVEGVRAGEGIDDLSDRVRDVFVDADARRAELIARTEVVGMSNRAIYAAQTMSGVVHRRQWVAAMLRTRDSHKGLNGQVKGMDEKFTTMGGSTAEHPGGFGVAKEDCNCMCTTIAIVDEQPPKNAADLDIVQRDFESKLAPHEKKFARAVRRGFRKQQEEVLKALESYKKLS